MEDWIMNMFTSKSIGKLTIKNRIVRSATWEGMAIEGKVTDQLVDYYEQLAKGGVGLIISSYLYVSPEGRQHNTQISAHSDEMIAGLKQIAEVVHRHDCKIVGQIVHCGGQTTKEVIDGNTPSAPSGVESPGYEAVPRELTHEEVKELLQKSFANAALRVKKAGFDGVQLHGAHGYLLAQFLSPSRNVRTDEYGGTVENRSRFCLEAYQSIRKKVGKDFPVMIKLNSHDFMAGSTSLDDSMYLISALVEQGIDCIEISGGTPGSGRYGPARTLVRNPSEEAYFFEQAEKIRQVSKGVPLMLVGGIRSPEKIEELLAEGGVDFVSMSRPLIREPHLPKRWEQGDLTPAACMSCNKCFIPAFKGEGVRCMQIK